MRALSSKEPEPSAGGADRLGRLGADFADEKIKEHVVLLKSHGGHKVYGVVEAQPPPTRNGRVPLRALAHR